jgi:hypothetical protein
MSTAMSKNFTLEEMVSSETARSRKISNTPSPEVLASLQLLVDNVLQPVRDLYGKTVHVNSGYRSPELNKAVGGAANSQHIQGRAADISVGGKAENKALFDLICRSGIRFDQLIDEYDYRWVHVSYKNSGNRRQVLHLK